MFRPADRSSAYCSAGMTGPVILSAPGYRELELRGIPPGMFSTTEYESETIQLERGDSVIFLSDGVSESHNCAGDSLAWRGCKRHGNRRGKKRQKRFLDN